MVKYLSGRQKLRPSDKLPEDRYQYLGLDQAERNLADPASTSNSQLANGVLPITTSGSDGIIVNVDKSASGGYFAPLEMELIASILENSTA